jgi:hypothetical protein
VNLVSLNLQLQNSGRTGIACVVYISNCGDDFRVGILLGLGECRLFGKEFNMMHVHWGIPPVEVMFMCLGYFVRACSQVYRGLPSAPTKPESPLLFNLLPSAPSKVGPPPTPADITSTNWILKKRVEPPGMRPSGVPSSP